MAGYSGKPLAQKLGIKPAMTVTVINQPADYRQLLGEGADGVEFSDRASTDLSFVHLFTTRRSELEKQFSRLRKKSRIRAQFGSRGRKNRPEYQLM
jgi:hypothetical protein